MPLHRIILRLMLWSLGVAALVGVLAVLTGGDDVVGRVMGTAFATAGAALVMYPLSRAIDKEKWRQAGVFGMALVVVEYALILALIWEADNILPGNVDQEEIGLSMLTFAVTGVGAVIMLWLLRVAGGRAAAYAGLAVSAVVTVLWLIDIWATSYRDNRCVEIGFAVGGFGITAMLALIGFGVERRHWRWVGVACSIIAAAMATVGIWFEVQDPSDVFVVIATAAVIVAHANVVKLVPLKPGQQWLAIATIAAAIGTGVLTDAGLILFEGNQDLLARFAGAAGILTACGTLALLVLARLNRGIDLESGAGDLTHITVVCPRCRTKQDMPIGDAQCKSCGLRISTRVEEPTCPGCGYLLLHLTGDACPECGRAINAQAGA